VLRVEEGSLYPALHRLELAGDLAAEWGVSDNNRLRFQAMRVDPVAALRWE